MKKRRLKKRGTTMQDESMATAQFFASQVPESMRGGISLDEPKKIIAHVIKTYVEKPREQASRVTKPARNRTGG